MTVYIFILLSIQRLVGGEDQILPILNSVNGLHWAATLKHDPAGGTYRVSGDGPKLVSYADPTTDIGDGPGSLLTAEQIQSHPNYGYLASLKECGKFPPPSSVSSDLDDLEYEDITGIGKIGDSDEARVKRIVGGKAARKKRHPWMVQLYLVQSATGAHTFHCAGTIISSSTILTAAHCLTRIQAGYSLDVAVVGTNDRRDPKFCKTANSNENCTRDMLKIIHSSELYHSYCEGNLHHDIGLIYLKKPLIFSDSIQPVCLPQSERILESWPDLKMTAVGWGSTNKYVEGFNSALLKEVEVDLQPRSLCDKFHVRVYGRMGTERICTGGNAERATCNGDSGGGLMKSMRVQLPDESKSSNRVFQFGIVSAGGHATDTCGFQGRATIDTNILFYMEWILNHIKPGVSSYQLTSSATWQKTDKNSTGDDEESFLYKNEFSTGRHIDVSKHPNVYALPSLEQCGRFPFSKIVSVKAEKARDEVPLDIFDDEEITGGGEINRKKRIVGGSPTTLENYMPWMAQIYVRNVENNQLYIRCSGTIITKRHIMTAAHCVTELAIPFVFERIVVGQYNRNSTSECLEGQCFSPVILKRIADVIIHPDYEKFTHRHNLAIVRLAEDLQFNQMVQPICLPRREALLEGLRVHRYFSAGWGKITRESYAKPNDKFSELLLQIPVTLKPRKECDFLYTRAIDSLGRERICGGGQAGRGECLGDGGSPLMKKLEMDKANLLHNKVFQVGLVAFTDCGMEGMPTAYLNIIYYMEWILNNIGDNFER